MTLLISVIAAIVLVFGMGKLAPFLPFNQLLEGSFYQVVAILLAILISALLNLPMLYMFRANSAYKKGDFKGATALYKKAYKTKRLSPDMEIYCGYILLKEGDVKTSEEILSKVKTKNLNDRQKNSLDTNEAILLWKKGELDSAIELLKAVWARCEAVNVAGTLGALMLIKARETGDFSEAMDFIKMTNEKFTYEKTILANLGEAYYGVNDNINALKTFEELMDCGCNSPAPFYYYGKALEKAEKKEEAKEMYNKALRMRFSNLSTISKKQVKEDLEKLSAE